MSHTNAANPNVAGPQDYSFTRRPDPDGSHALALLGVLPMGDHGLVPRPAKLRQVLPRVQSKDSLPHWQRNPLQVPMSSPPFPQGTRRGLTQEVVDTMVKREMAAIFAGQDTGPTSHGCRMVVVDESFYGEPRDRNWRPQPIRKGAGKGPRKHHLR